MADNFEEIKKWDKFSKFHVLNSTNYLISKLNHKKNLVVVDVGANSGTFFDLLFEGLDIERAVLFEPHPKLYGYLTKKYENNKNIVVENIALSDSIRPYNLNVGAFEYNIENNLNNDSYNLGLSYVDFDNHSDTKTNYFDNLKDRYHLDRVDLLKIDTETEDLFVLKGFTETIKNLK
jgi:FkbM family methyltransferase